MIEKFVRYTTLSVRPRWFQSWLRRHQRLTLASILIGFAWTLNACVGEYQAWQRDRELCQRYAEAGARRAYRCQNPECPQAGHCGGVCAENF